MTYMILTTRQKRQLLHSPSAHLSVGNQQTTEVSDHKVLGVTIDNNLTWGPHIRDLCKTTAKKVYQSAKIMHFLNFHARKTFFQAHIQSGIDYASTLWDSASDSLQKPLKTLHRRAIKTVLLKRTSLTDKDYKAAQILLLSSRLMSNKARFVHKIVSGRAPIYLSTKLLINQSSRNSSRKLNVPIPRIDLFKSSLVYFVYLCCCFVVVFKCSLSTCFSVYWCPFQHGLYECTCTQHTVAHCILS